jgi:hypothetical protein
MKTEVNETINVTEIQIQKTVVKTISIINVDAKIKQLMSLKGKVKSVRLVNSVN